MNGINGVVDVGGSGFSVVVPQKALAEALNRAQKNIGAAKKEAANPFFKSSYATLGSVMEACKDALNAEGITVLQPIGRDALGDFVETILLHTSGESISSRMYLTGGKNMQDLGSAISYARRYSLQSLVFIPAVDDDGNAASGNGKERASTKAETKTDKKEQPPKEEPVKESPKPAQPKVTETDW